MSELWRLLLPSGPMLLSKRGGRRKAILYNLQNSFAELPKYPRTQAEFITEATCGFYFKPAKEDVVYEPSGNKISVPIVD